MATGDRRSRRRRPRRQEKREAVDQVRGLGPRQHRLGRHPARGRRGDAAPARRPDPEDPGRARHPALDRQPQRSRRGDGEAEGIRHRRVLPLPADQLELQGRLGRPDRRRTSTSASTPSPSSTTSRSSARRWPSPTPRCSASTPPLLEDFLDRPALNPRFVTEDSRLRRRMYQADIERNRVEAEYVGPQGGVPRHPRDDLHHRPLPRGGPQARRGADRAHQPAQHHRLHLLLRGARRAAPVPPPPAPDLQPGRPPRHLRQDRPHPGRDGPRGLDRQAPADVLPGDVQGGGDDHAPPHPAAGEGGRRQAARRVRLQRPQPPDADHLQVRRLQGDQPRGRAWP